MARNTTPEKNREYNTRSYAKKLGLTVEQLEARRQAAREWKARNKYRRKQDGYIKLIESEKLKSGPKTGAKAVKVKVDAWWERLKSKHEGKPRLDKSIIKPEFLTHSPREKLALVQVEQ